MRRGVVAPISSKGQVTLPKHVRELLHVETGDYVRFTPSRGGILITRIALEPEGFSDAEWQALEQLAHQKGTRYKSAKAFLEDLERL